MPIDSFLNNTGGGGILSNIAGDSLTTDQKNILNSFVYDSNDSKLTLIRDKYEVKGDEFINNVTKFESEDGLIKLANNSITDTSLIGFYGLQTGTAFGGLLRNHLDNKFKLFTSIGIEPSVTNIPVGNATLELGNIIVNGVDMSNFISTTLQIDDLTTSASKLWSSSKINSEISNHSGDLSIHRVMNDSTISASQYGAVQK